MMAAFKVKTNQETFKTAAVKKESDRERWKGTKSLISLRERRISVCLSRYRHRKSSNGT